MSIKSELRKAPALLRKTPTLLRKTPALLSTALIRLIYFLPSLLLLALRVEFVWTLLPDRIGHLCVDIDSYLKDMQLGRRPRKHPIYLELKKPANRVLLNYWGRYIWVVTNPVAVALLRPFISFSYLVADLQSYATVLRSVAGMSATYAAWDKRPSLLELTEEHIARGEAELRKMGIPEGAWFVCLHSRDRGYAVHDDDLHDFRNCSIETYRLAAAEIVARGGYCVRVGDPSAAAMAPTEGVIDYVHSAFVSDWMDVFLCARCRFYLGNSSGLFAISTVFGVPCALAHSTPLETSYMWTPFDLTIPKLLADSNGRMMSIRDVLNSPAAAYRFTPEFKAAGITHIDNTAEEVRDLAVEMMERIDGTAVYTAEDERLQRVYRGLLRPEHYSYGAAGRVGREFLRRHANLFDEPHIEDAGRRAAVSAG